MKEYIQDGQHLQLSLHLVFGMDFIQVKKSNEKKKKRKKKRN